MNDLETNARCMKIRQLAEKLPLLQRENKEHALAMALSDIEMLARDAQYRLNDMLYRQGKSHPLAEPMGG